MLDRIEFAPEQKCPLDGVRILDLSRVVAGNALTVALADFGAEVIKIETPGKGDDLRNWKVKGVSTSWKVYSRNKKSVSLNLRDERGKDILCKLVTSAQVFVENFRPGTLEKMGLSPQELHALNPDLVIVRISGWGQDGPYQHKPGFGTLIEAMSGFAAMNGFEDRPPVLPNLAMADMVAGLSGATAVMVALWQVRVNGGKGQVIDLPLFDPLHGILGPLAANYRLSSEVPKRLGSRFAMAAPRNAYATKDGGWVAMSASTQGMWEQVAKSIDREELIADPRFLTNADRLTNVEALDAIIGGWIAERDRDTVLAHFDAAGVTVGPICTIADLVDGPFDDYVRGRRILVEVPDADMGTIPMPTVAARLSDTPGALRRPAPAIGEHNDEILGELGIDAATRDRLSEEGAI